MLCNYKGEIWRHVFWFGWRNWRRGKGRRNWTTRRKEIRVAGKRRTEAGRTSQGGAEAGRDKGNRIKVRNKIRKHWRSCRSRIILCSTLFSNVLEDKFKDCWV